MSDINRVAISEVLDILNNMPSQDVDKISIRFMDYLNKNASESYVSKIDFSRPLKENQLSNDTLCYLYMIYTKYWCDSNERDSFVEKMTVLRNEQEKLNREKYNPNNVFQNKRVTKGISVDMQENTNNTALAEYKESFFTKFKNFIFRILHINK